MTDMPSPTSGIGTGEQMMGGRVLPRLFGNLVTRSQR